MDVDAANATSAALLVFACFHALSYASVYIMSLVRVIIDSEKSKTSKMPTRIVAAIYLLFYFAYNAVVYSMVLYIVNWKGLFRERLWQGSIFDQKWSFVLYYEPLLLILTTWYKVACAGHSWLTQASHTTLERQLTRHQQHTSARDQLPFLTVIMPIYNEPLPSLMTAINSVCEVKYPLDRMHLVLAFDDDRITDIYRGVMHCLYSNEKIQVDSIGHKIDPNRQFPEKIEMVRYRGLKVSSCRFKHGGKRHAQMCAYYYLDSQVFVGLVRKPLLLFIDSDIQLDPYAVSYFVHNMEFCGQQEGLRREGLTGLITCKTAGTYNFWKVLQDTEYIESQMLHRNTEDYLGSVTCLPGALTMVRFEALKAVAPLYFNQMEATDSLDFQRCHLGEDRYLTHLLMEHSERKYRIGFCASAKCKTEGCTTLRQLMKQRRRWYLGTLANEIYMLTSPTLWTRYTGLMIMTTVTSLKNGPLFIYVFVSEALNGWATPLSLMYIALIFLPIWAFVILYGIRLRRVKIMWCYPLILALLPIMNACFQFYGMMTMSVRTWGGPRADASKNAPHHLHAVSVAVSVSVHDHRADADAADHPPPHQSVAALDVDADEPLGFSPKRLTPRKRAVSQSQSQSP